MCAIPELQLKEQLCNILGKERVEIAHGWIDQLIGDAEAEMKAKYPFFFSGDHYGNRKRLAVEHVSEELARLAKYTVNRDIARGLMQLRFYGPLDADLSQVFVQFAALSAADESKSTVKDQWKQPFGRDAPLTDDQAENAAQWAAAVIEAVEEEVAQHFPGFLGKTEEEEERKRKILAAEYAAESMSALAASDDPQRVAEGVLKHRLPLPEDALLEFQSTPCMSPRFMRLAAQAAQRIRAERKLRREYSCCARASQGLAGC